MNPNEIAKVGAIGSEPAGGYQAGQVSRQDQVVRQNKPAPEMPAHPAVAGIGEVQVSFKVEGSNNEVTITVIDKESGKVIRTIPFDKMQEISTGGLFQYSK